MKWESSREDDSFLPRCQFASGPSSISARRIFVVNQTSQLPVGGTQGQTIQRILIFDDHPDTLRLVFGRGAPPPAEPAVEEGKRWWEPIWGWTLLLGVMVFSLLSLFLKWPG